MPPKVSITHHSGVSASINAAAAAAFTTLRRFWGHFGPSYADSPFPTALPPPFFSSFAPQYIGRRVRHPYEPGPAQGFLLLSTVVNVNEATKIKLV